MSANYVVTGASGVLGAALATRLNESGLVPTGLGRKPKPSGFVGHWLQCDLTDPARVQSCLAGSDVVVHCASSPFEPEKDRIAMQNLIAVAKDTRCHLVYVSICSMESAAPYNDYYKSKLADERDLETSGVSYGIVRITQFHPFVSRLLSRLVVGPFILAPKLQFQPIDVEFAAEVLCKFAMDRKTGRSPDVHGPQSLQQRELIHTWLRRMGMKKILLPIPRIGKLKQLGRIEPVEGLTGGRTWQQWLRDEGGSPSPYTW